MIKNLLLFVIISAIFCGGCKKEEPSLDSFLTSGTWVEKTYQKSGDVWFGLNRDTIEYNFNSNLSGVRIFRSGNRTLFRSGAYGRQPTFYTDTNSVRWNATNGGDIVYGGGVAHPALNSNKLTFSWKYELKTLHLKFNEVNETREWEIVDFNSDRMEAKPQEIISENISVLVPNFYGSSSVTLKTVFERK